MKKVVIASLFSLLLIATFAFIFLRNSKDESTDTSTTQSNQKTYIALGDSVAAGVGLLDPSDSSACNRTDQSYPVVLAGIIDYKVLNKSCSGATSKEGLQFGQTVNKLLIDPQLTVLDPSIPTDLITITIGANDVGWVDKLQTCFLSDCTLTLDSQTLIPDFVLMQNDLSEVLSKLSASYTGTTPKILITGYYPLYANTISEDCTDAAGLTVAEIESINLAQIQLDTAIRNTLSSYPRTEFVSLNFNDHTLCSEDPWIQGINDRQPYHPNEKGQRSIAEQIAALL